MGEVFLAEDTRLRRRVALKVLAENIAADADRLLRFEREAFAASALNHPNILTIFEFGAEDQTHFLASEFVDGESLRKRMSRTTMTVTTTLEIAIQIASALQAAHDAGIIHRDIKPDNVMIRADGYVKVLDFGLAKLTSSPVVAGRFDSSEEATRKQLQTQAGLIIGTVAYMSPEQARGHEVDKRTDIWSLGCVLYEMLTRQQPFRGETITDILANLIHREPISVLTLRKDANAELERIVTRTLSKNKNERYQTASDLQVDLKQLQKRLEFEAELERTSPPSRTVELKTQIIRPQTTASSETRNSIAVLPFSNLSADPNNEYFCDGLAEELLNALAKIDHLKVAARTSAFSFKGKNTNVSEIGQKLSVRTVLEGSVRRSGNRLRITVQLVNASDGYHLWSERYDREMQDIFDVQDEITLAIIDVLKVKLFGDEKAALLKRYTDNTEAYQLYLQGRYCYNKYTPDYFQQGIEYFEKAIELDPEYAPAYAGLGFCYGTLFYFGSVAPHQIVPKWRALIDRAVEIDDRLGDAYLSRASIEFYYDWDFAKAELDYRRAIELNPNSPDAHWRYGHFLANCERFDEAIKEGERAIELDPLSLVVQFFMARIYGLAQRVDQGFEQLRKMQAIEPNFAGALTQSGGLYLMTGKYDEAIEAYKKALTLGHFVVPALSYLGAAYGVAGKRDDADKILNQLFEMKKSQYVSPFSIARVYAGLGENDKAFEWFEKAFEERSGEMVAIKSEVLAHFMGDTIIRDDRFQDLVRRVGMRVDQPSLNKPTSEADEAPTALLSPVRLSITLLSLVLLIGTFFGYRYFSSNKQFESIAVLPFQNSSADPDAEYLSDGLAESLIYRLSQLPKLKVSPTSSVMRYKGKQSDVNAIASELGVSAVMTGRIAQRGDNLTISVELVDVRNNKLLWGEQYERKMAELLATQREIATEIVQKLRLKISGNNEPGLTKHYTENNEAYQLYLKGRFYWNKRTEGGMQKSLEYFQQAVERDPNFALAYSGLADAYDLLAAPDASGAMPANEAMPKAKAAALKALEIDGALAEPHVSLAHVKYYYDRDWAGAEREYKRAIELNPNYPTAHQWYAVFLMSAGRFDEALTEARRARELEPLSLPINMTLGWVLLTARQYDRSIEQLRKTLEMDPNFILTHHRLGLVYEQMGKYDEAIAEFRQVRNLSAGKPLGVATLAHAYALSGRRAEAQKTLAELQKISEQHYVSPASIAIIYAALGDKDQAFAWLEKADKERDGVLARLRVDSRFDSLRSDPRFSDLAKRVGLPQ